MYRPRFAAIGLCLLMLLTGCTSAAPSMAVTSTMAPTSAVAVATPVPTATPLPVFAVGSSLGGIEVGGLDQAAALTLLREQLPVPSPLRLRAGSARLTIEPDDIGLVHSAEALLEEALDGLGDTRPVTLPLRVVFDDEALGERLEGLSGEVGRAPTVRVLTETATISRSFAYTPGLTLDLDAAMRQIRAALEEAEPGVIELELVEDPEVPVISLEQMRDELVAMDEAWPGIVGVHLIDLATGESIGLNDRTVFAGASTIKTAIMLYAYTQLDEFDEDTEAALEAMITESDNLASNDVLAVAAGALGTEYAFLGADAMSVMLEEQLGLRHTYLFVPFEASDYIRVYKPSFRCGPEGRVGEAPFTETGSCLRAEPESMARLYQLIDQCAQGEGELLELFEKLSPSRCTEMLDRLAMNEDATRMVAGVPEGVRVEHKSGWIETMQSDVGIVRSPGGAYVLAIYLYRPLLPGQYFWADEVMAPLVASFSRLAYTAYNPIRLDITEEEE
ncbi:serine hydrolase [Candidatus Chloroploca sp. M-50]|uniref:Serine hydrolase n=1 Tax=Candidatus Chloroploca mongolica TaxID=2528176 RepID=A0ABS4D849_9CHLR|nr:serine hydrolase [Candidatus Chloroploca mongolica]MBP1465613.1 serine hydrolase [Candidatus Chloroploca mongolica]